jgi:flagellar basal body-associated protein FliL
MKSNSLNTVLTVVLAVLVAATLFCSWRSVSQTHGAQALMPQAQQASQVLGKTEALLTELNAYNQRAQSPEMNPTVSPDESARRISALENQVTILLLVLVVLAGALALFFFRQASDANKQYTQTVQMLNTYNRNANNIKMMVSQLGAYGATHRDIQPILERYGVMTAPAGAAPTAPRR